MSKKVIIYVDDDPDDLELLKDTFKKVENVQLVCLGKQEELFEILDHHSGIISLIILDINMPQKSGTEILIELKSNTKYSKFPVVMLSTAKNSNDNETIRKLDCEIVLKPSSYTEMKTLSFRLMQYFKE